VTHGARSGPAIVGGQPIGYHAPAIGVFMIGRFAAGADGTDGTLDTRARPLVAANAECINGYRRVSTKPVAIGGTVRSA
jgi:hypothetical protein